MARQLLQSINVTLRRLAIFLFSAAMLSGLILLGYLLIDFVADSTTGTLIQHIQASPLNWSYALACSIIFISFLIWLPSRLPAWRFQFAFRKIDSATLDTDAETCCRFYREALAFRCRYGSKQFERHLIRHFDFVYDYHRDALRWMDEIVTGVAAGHVPVDFIVASICSGQIGRIYAGACYGGGGLANSLIALDEPVFLHARLDSIEIWSATSAAPVSMLRRQPLELELEQGLPDNLNCYLTGVDKDTGKPLRLKLRCYSGATETQHDASRASQPLQAFHAWVRELAVSFKHPNQNNFGIDVAEIQEQEQTFIAQTETTPLNLQLQQVLGSHIDGFFTRTTLPINDPNTALAAVVLCSGLGIVTITEIPLAGSITYSGDPHWFQIEEGESQRFDNACLQAQRAKTALANLLSVHGLIRWPVHNLVVFSDPAVSLNLAVGKQRVQCEVITLRQLPNWFALKNTDDTIRFTKDDYNRFIALLDPARVQVEQAMQA